LQQLPIIGRHVRRKVLRGLGLDHTRLAFYGSAPSPVELIEWYRALGLELLEVYGMTEGWAYSHMGRVGEHKPGWVGPPVPGVEHRLTSEGEICVRSPGTMLGYYKEPGLTREMIDAEGRLRITGRVKELFKTSKGKYVAPAPIENRLLAHNGIEQACVSGASMPQPYAIVVLSKHGESNWTEEKLKALRDEVNASLDHHERLQVIVVSGTPWTVENGLLTPTLKLKRSAIEERAAPHVAEWYASGKAVIWESN